MGRRMGRREKEKQKTKKGGEEAAAGGEARTNRGVEYKVYGG